MVPTPDRQPRRGRKLATVPPTGGSEGPSKPTLKPLVQLPTKLPTAALRAVPEGGTREKRTLPTPPLHSPPKTLPLPTPGLTPKPQSQVPLPHEPSALRTPAKDRKLLPSPLSSRPRSHPLQSPTALRTERTTLLQVPTTFRVKPPPPIVPTATLPTRTTPLQPTPPVALPQKQPTPNKRGFLYVSELNNLE